MSEKAKTMLILVAGVLAAAGGAMITAGDWSDVLSPQGIGGILLAVGGATGTWMAKPYSQARRLDNGR